jgi:hypothetical protein
MTKTQKAEVVGYFTMTIISKVPGSRSRTIQTIRVGFCGYVNKLELESAKRELAKKLKESASKEYPANYHLEVRARVTTTECDWIINGNKDAKGDK